MVPDRNNYYGLVDRDFQRTRADISTLDASYDFGGHKLRNIARLGNTSNDYLWTQPDDSQGNQWFDSGYLAGGTPVGGGSPPPVTGGSGLGSLPFSMKKDTTAASTTAPSTRGIPRADRGSLDS